MAIDVRDPPPTSARAKHRYVSPLGSTRHSVCEAVQGQATAGHGRSVCTRNSSQSGVHQGWCEQVCFVNSVHLSTQELVCQLVQ